MSSRISEDKQQDRDIEENYIDLNLIDTISEAVVSSLTNWANKNIFSKINGKLIFSIPLNESVNAGARYNSSSTSYAPEIFITLGMIREIYRDSFTFPLVSNRIAEETSNIAQLNDIFNNEVYVYSSGVPVIREQCKSQLAKITESAYKEIKNERISTNDITCRFLMFEFMVSWVFFHELSHIIQQHNLLKTSVNEDEFYEISSAKGGSDSDLDSQAREILADIEGLGLTLQYLHMNGVFCSETSYLLLSSISCMFNRFYDKYEEKLEVSNGTHPHPTIRNDFIHNCFVKLLYEILKSDFTDNTARALAYISTRSMLLTGIFWAHRYHKYDGESLPSFLELSSASHSEQLSQYRRELTTSINKQIETIVDNHILDSNLIESLYQSGFFENGENNAQ